MVKHGIILISIVVLLNNLSMAGATRGGPPGSFRTVYKSAGAGGSGTPEPKAPETFKHGRVPKGIEALAVIFKTLSDRVKFQVLQPSELVVSMLELCVVQLMLFRAVRDEPSSAPYLRMQAANSIYGTLTAVSDNFKMQKRGALGMVATGDKRLVKSFLSEVDPDAILMMRKMIQDCPDNTLNAFECTQTKKRIRCFVDAEELMANRYLAAEPLIERLVEVLQGTHDAFARGKRDGAWSIVYEERRKQESLYRRK